MEIKLTPNAILKPTMPPGPIEGFVDSDILLDLKGIPSEIGNCTITGVRVTVMNPDNAIATVDCTRESDGTWSCAVPASTKSGRMHNGVQILIDGTTPGGGTVDGYVLAVCNLAIYTRDMKIKPNGTLLRYFDVAPEAPKKCDVAPFDDVLKMYNGTEWQAFGAEVDLSDYYTKEETDEAIDRLAAYYITADAQGNNFATRAALLNAETYYSGGVARTPTRNDYAVVLADETHDGAEYRYIFAVAEGQTTGQWEAQYPIETNDYSQLSNKPQIGGVELTGNKTAAELGLATPADTTLNARAFTAWTISPSSITYDGQTYDSSYYAPEWSDPFSTGYNWYFTSEFGIEEPIYSSGINDTSLTYTFGGQTVTATRSAIGYNLGTQTDKPLASEEEAAALREGKMDKLANATAGHVPVILNNGNLDDSGKSIEDLATKDDATLYPCYTAWSCSPATVELGGETVTIALTWQSNGGQGPGWYLNTTGDIKGTKTSTSLSWAADEWPGGVQLTATRTVLPNGYELGDQANKPLAREEEAEALRSALPYALATPVTIDSAQTDTSGGTTINYGAVTCSNRTDHPVAIIASLDELRIMFPAAVANHVRDFYLRIDVGSGAAALTAPAIVPIAPTGETITVEAQGGTMPTLADGTASSVGTTMLYFTETSTAGKFMVKAEIIEEVA